MKGIVECVPSIFFLSALQLCLEPGWGHVAPPGTSG